MSCIIKNRIYLGEFYDINSKVLEKNRIKRIINCSFNNPKNVDLEKYEYHQIKIYDSVNQNIIPFIDKFSNILKEEKSTLINCYAGVSRSATIVIGILIKRYGMSLEDSFSHVLKKRPKINPNVGFMTQLQEYEKKCVEEKEKRDTNVKKIQKGMNMLKKFTSLF